MIIPGEEKKEQAESTTNSKLTPSFKEVQSDIFA